MTKKDNKFSVILFRETPYNKWHRHRLDIDAYGRANIDIKVYDFSAYINNERKTGLAPEYKEHYEIGTLTQVLKHLRKIERNTILIDNLGKSIKAQLIWAIADRLRVRKAVFETSAIHRNVRSNNFSVLSGKTKIILRVCRRLIYALTPFKQKHEIRIKQGGKILDKNDHKYQKNIQTNVFDYDDFLDLTEDGDSEEIITVLDERVGCGEEDEVLSKKLSRERYQKIVTKLIEILGENTRRRVVIACHPKSDPSALQDEFNGVPVFYGKTLELIQKSYIVVGHASASLNMAVLLKKRILLFDYKEMRGGLTYPYMEHRAGELGLKILKMDNIKKFRIIEELNKGVDTEAYHKYVQNYLVSKPNEKNSSLLIRGLTDD